MARSRDALRAVNCGAVAYMVNRGVWYNHFGIAYHPQERIMGNDPVSPSEPPRRAQVPPEILEWARQTFDEEAFLADVRDIEATGGLRLEDFIAELEERVRRP
jgi:hypothetical protein